MLKKILSISISIFCLLSIFAFAAKADEKIIPENYQYVFKVGSSDFHGEVDGVEGKGSLLYPIIVDKLSGRTGIDYEIFFSFIPRTNNIQMEINFDGVSKIVTLNIFYKPKNSILVCKYPSQKTCIDGDEVLGEFPIQYITEGINTNANWNGKKIKRETTYLIPLRLIFEFTGHSVDWNPDTQEITVTYPAKQ